MVQTLLVYAIQAFIRTGSAALLLFHCFVNMSHQPPSLLASIVSGLKSHKATQLKGEQRAAVALIIRVPGPSSAAASHNSQSSCPASDNETDISHFLSQPWVQQGLSSVELLFIQRPHNPRDPWSGQVAFPGGHRDKEDR